MESLQIQARLNALQGQPAHEAQSALLRSEWKGRRGVGQQVLLGFNHLPTSLTSRNLCRNLNRNLGRDSIIRAQGIEMCPSLALYRIQMELHTFRLDYATRQY